MGNSQGHVSNPLSPPNRGRPPHATRNPSPRIFPDGLLGLILLLLTLEDDRPAWPEGCDECAAEEFPTCYRTVLD
jgi:hypothetical protein